MAAYDILVIGATGFTGKLVARYLSTHKLRSSYTLALGARSPSKLDGVYKDLSLDDAQVQKVQVDVTNKESVETAIKGARVVINTVGPFYRWGTPVVAACANHGVHYVDCTAEAPWIMDIIETYDYVASKTGAIILPACGLDCIPSDISVYISSQTLKAHNPNLQIDTSTSAYNVRMGLSGGTVASLVTMTDEVPTKKFIDATKDYCCSPVKGSDRLTPKLYYKLPHVQPSVYGAIWHMGLSNRSMIQRTWGLQELAASKSHFNTKAEEEEIKRVRYGPEFKYDEFHIKANPIAAILFTLGFGVGFGFIALLKPIRWLLRTFGESMAGPSEEVMKKGILEVTNITTSVATPDQPPVHVKTFLRGKGDPGFLVTSVMLSETALTVLLNTTPTDRSKLPLLGQRGGILTTAAACGDLLVNRLKESGWFDIESEIVESWEDKKHV